MNAQPMILPGFASDAPARLPILEVRDVRKVFGGVRPGTTVAHCQQDIEDQALEEFRGLSQNRVE